MKVTASMTWSPFLDFVEHVNYTRTMKFFVLQRKLAMKLHTESRSDVAIKID